MQQRTLNPEARRRIESEHLPYPDVLRQSLSALVAGLTREIPYVGSVHRGLCHVAPGSIPTDLNLDHMYMISPPRLQAVFF